MSQNTCTEDRFLKNVENHEITVIRDDGVNRHLRFRKARPAGSEYWFELVTWPGVLCINGDMGTYVFSRTHDMFEFFRCDREYLLRKGVKLGINKSYWAEKLQAPASRDATEYSEESFRQHVQQAYDNWVESNKPPECDEYTTEADVKDFYEKSAHFLADLTSDVLSTVDDGDVRAYDAARNFSSEAAPDFNMDDCWEWNCREYKFHFVWCCYAIAWGIQKYDDLKSGVAVAEVVEVLEGGAA